MGGKRYWWLLAQAAFMCAAAGAGGVAPYLFYGLVDAGVIETAGSALQWAFVPLCALASAYFVTRRGVNRYLAWILPPVCYSAVPWLATGYPPRAGAMLLCALLGVVGAAAGEVKNQMENDKK